MEFSHLKYFIRASELNSISKAASEFNVATSVISSHISSLERELGVQLFDRLGKTIQLNEIGHIAYRHALKITDMMNDVCCEICDNNDSLEYTLLVSTLTIPKVVPFLVRGFQKQYPQIKLRMLQYQKAKDIRDMNCDIMLYSSNEPISQNNSRTLYKEPICLLAAKTHHLAQQKEILPEQLEEEYFIRSSENSDFGQLTTAIFQRMNLSPRIAAITDYPSFALEMVACGMGIAFQPYLTWCFDLPSFKEKITPIPVKGFDAVRYINITWNAERYYSKAMDHFIEYAIEFMRELDQSQGDGRGDVL